VNLPTGTPDDELLDPAWGVPKPSELSYEQRLWDEVATAMYAGVGLDPDMTWSRAAQRSFTAADAFMAERAKRVK
jgi:hypothetical protein